MNPLHAETADLLRRAAAHVRETGLYKHLYWPAEWNSEHYPTAPACTVGHLMVAADVWRNYFGFTAPLVQAAMQAMALALGTDPDPDPDSAFTAVTRWNDAPERTAEEVATLMETTALRLAPVTVTVTVTVTV
jgi:hypothetical protein